MVKQIVYAGIFTCSLVLGVSPTVVTAHIGSVTPGVIHSCVKNEEIRIISATGTCQRSETPVDWNTVGPQGPIGPIGPTGSAGPQGPQGATGSQGPTGLVGATDATGAAGPAGPVGPAGPQGPVGMTGPQGQPGISDYTLVSISPITCIPVDPNVVKCGPVTAQCPNGSVVLSCMPKLAKVTGGTDGDIGAWVAQVDGITDGLTSSATCTVAAYRASFFPLRPISLQGTLTCAAVVP